MKHTLTTRMLHAGPVFAVVVQPATSQFTQDPRPNIPDGTLFVAHSNIGMITPGPSLLFRLALAMRRHGTALGAVFPGISGQRLPTPGAGIAAHVKAGLCPSLPPYDENGRLDSIVHGLGLLVVPFMGLTGAGWFFTRLSGTAVAVFEEFHKIAANMAWACLFGRAAFASVHHPGGVASLSETRPVRR